MSKTLAKFKECPEILPFLLKNNFSHKQMKFILSEIKSILTPSLSALNFLTLLLEWIEHNNDASLSKISRFEVVFSWLLNLHKEDKKFLSFLNNQEHIDILFKMLQSYSSSLNKLPKNCRTSALKEFEDYKSNFDNTMFFLKSFLSEEQVSELQEFKELIIFEYSTVEPQKKYSKSDLLKLSKDEHLQLLKRVENFNYEQSLLIFETAFEKFDVGTLKPYSFSFNLFSLMFGFDSLKSDLNIFFMNFSLSKKIHPNYPYFPFEEDNYKDFLYNIFKKSLTYSNNELLNLFLLDSICYLFKINFSDLNFEKEKISFLTSFKKEFFSSLKSKFMMESIDFFKDTVDISGSLNILGIDVDIDSIFYLLSKKPKNVNSNHVYFEKELFSSNDNKIDSSKHISLQEKLLIFYDYLKETEPNSYNSILNLHLFSYSFAKYQKDKENKIFFKNFFIFDLIENQLNHNSFSKDDFLVFLGVNYTPSSIFEVNLVNDACSNSNIQNNLIHICKFHHKYIEKLDLNTLITHLEGNFLNFRSNFLVLNINNPTFISCFFEIYFNKNIEDTEKFLDSVSENILSHCWNSLVSKYS